MNMIDSSQNILFKLDSAFKIVKTASFLQPARLPRNSVVETPEKKSLKTMKMKDKEKRKFKQDTDRRTAINSPRVYQHLCY